MKSLGIVINPTSIDAAWLDVASQSVTDFQTVPFPAPLENLPAEYVEILPSSVVQSVLSLINLMCRDVAADVEVWLSGKRGGMVLSDGQGKARSNFYAWQDRRTLRSGLFNKTHLERLADQWNDQRYAQLKQELSPSSMVALLYTLSEEGELPDGVIPLNIQDFLISHLCGQPGVMHCTRGVGLLDIETNDWFYKAFERCGLGDLWLPEVARSLAAIGQAASGSRTFHFRPSVDELQMGLLGAKLAPREVAIHIANGVRVSVIQQGNGAISPYSVPYFQKQRLLSTFVNLAVPENEKSSDSGEQEMDNHEKCRHIAEQCEVAASRLIHLSRFDSLLLAVENEADVGIFQNQLSERFGKEVRLLDRQAPMFGLLELASHA